MKGGQSNANTFPSQLIFDVRQTNNLQTINTVRKINRQNNQEDRQIAISSNSICGKFLAKVVMALKVF